MRLYCQPWLNKFKPSYSYDSFNFESRKTVLVGHEIALFQPLMQRVDPKAVAAMVDASKDSLAAPAEAPKTEKKKKKPKEKSRTKSLVKWK